MASFILKRIDIYESEDLNYFSDLVTYAFVSPERLELKKTGWSFDVKLNNVKPTKKMTKADNSTNTLLARIELRATEFGDYTTFRLIAEAQALMATFMSHLKQKYEVSMSDDEKYLALLWPKFLTDIKSLFEKNKVMLNLVDEDRGAAIEILRNKPEFKKECRALMADYSKKVLRRVFKK
ncbi:MAG: hypothetical protein HY226_00265 [Candidatus Vogelbacteria bacterium]|nr:hypothetical protein [Candidatus Vogelbacteria bacterium]